MAAGALFILFIMMGLHSQEGKVWLLIFIGMSFWVIGEFMWFYYSMIIYEEPFPSYTDIAYISGYVFLIVGMTYKAMNTKVGMTPSKISAIVVPIVIIAIATAYFVAFPVITAEDYSTLDIAISLAYPMMDIVLLGLSLYILMSFFWGSFTPNGWIIIAIGVILMTIADIIFTAMDWQGIYYPITDVLYIWSYMAFAIGAIYQIKFIRELLG